MPLSKKLVELRKPATVLLREKRGEADADLRTDSRRDPRRVEKTGASPSVALPVTPACQKRPSGTICWLTAIDTLVSSLDAVTVAPPTRGRGELSDWVWSPPVVFLSSAARADVAKRKRAAAMRSA